MRILLVSIEYPPFVGGVATSVQRVAEGLRDAGHDVVVVTRDKEDMRFPNQAVVGERQLNGVRIVTMTRRLMPAAGLPFHKSILQRLVDDVRPDVVHSYFVWPSGLLGHLCASLARAPHIVSCRGADVTEAALEHPANFCQVVRRASRVTTVASSLTHWIRLISGVDDALYIPNSIPVDFFESAAVGKQEARASYGLPSDATIVGALHSFRWKKNPEYLRALVARLGSSGIGNLCFVLAGLYDEELADALRRECSGPEASGTMQFVALSKVARADLGRVLSALDLFVLTSRHEGMANVMLEALACSTPVAATAVDGAIDVLAGSGAGVLLPRFDVAGASDELVRLVSAPDALSAMSERCRPLIRDRYLLHHEIGAWQQLYVDVTERHRRSDTRARPVPSRQPEGTLS